MKKFFIILFCLIFIYQIKSADVILAWDANTEADLAGYKLHYGTISKNYTNYIDVKNVTIFTITNLNTNVTYYFAATAYNTSSLESEYSNEVSYTMPTELKNPVNLMITKWKKRKYKISEELILEISNNVNNLTLRELEKCSREELIKTVKYWKNQHDDLLEYLNTEIKTKANECINLIHKILDDNTKNKI